MARSPEGPSNPLKQQRAALLRRVFRPRQNPKIFGNPVSSQHLTNIENLIKKAPEKLELSTYELVLSELEENLK